MARTVHTSLLIIGGAEDKVGRATILRRFVRLAGGRKARIVVIPSASSFPDEVVETYTTIFGRLGAPAVVVVDPPSRPAAAAEALVQAIDDATGVFMAGGNQHKLSQLFVGTPLADAISRGARAWRRRGRYVRRSLDHEPVHDLPGCRWSYPSPAHQPALVRTGPAAGRHQSTSISTNEPATAA